MNRIHPRRRTAAFTWIEALVIVAVLTVLTLVVMPRVHRARSRARRISCAGNLKQIGLGIKMYAGDHGEQQYPDSIKDASRYLAHQAKLFTCSEDRLRTPVPEIADMTAANNSYLYRLYATNSTSPRLSESTRPNQLLMFDKNGTRPPPTVDVEARGAWGGNHRGHGGNILFCDGHVEWFNAHDQGGQGELSNEEWFQMTATGGLHASAWEDDSVW